MSEENGFFDDEDLLAGFRSADEDAQPAVGNASEGVALPADPEEDPLARLEEDFAADLVSTSPRVSAAVGSPTSPVSDDAAAFSRAVPATESPDAKPARKAKDDGPLPSTRSPKKAAATAPKVKTIPALSSFDLLEGEYQRARRQRLIMFVSLGVALLFFLFVASQAVTQQLEVRRASTSLARVKGSVDTQRIQYGKLTNVNGVPGYDIQKHTEKRAELARTITSAEADVAAVLAEVQRAVPAGVTVRSVNLTPLDGKAAEAKGVTDAKGAYQITITLVATDYQAAATWVAQAQALEFLEAVDTKWSGSEPALAVSTTAVLKSTSSARNALYAADVNTAQALAGEAVAKPASPAAPTDSTVPATTVPEGGS